MNAGSRGDLANNILQNSVFNDSFTMLENYYKDQMAQTTIADVEGRNKWHACLFVLNDVKTGLSAVVQNGEVDKANTKAREKVKENDGNSSDSTDQL